MMSTGTYTDTHVHMDACLYLDNEKEVRKDGVVTLKMRNSVSSSEIGGKKKMGKDVERY